MLNYIDHVLHLPLTFFSQRRVGEILSRIDDIKTIRQVISSFAISLLIDIVLVGAVGYFLVSNYATLFIISIATMPLSFITTCFASKIYSKRYKILASKASVQSAYAHDFIMRLPKGYDTLIAEYGLSLSGGEKQRIAIACALLADPSILIFDEAINNLDARSVKMFWILLDTLKDQHKTVICIAHHESDIPTCDHIVKLV